MDATTGTALTMRELILKVSVSFESSVGSKRDTHAGACVMDACPGFPSEF